MKYQDIPKRENDPAPIHPNVDPSIPPEIRPGNPEIDKPIVPTPPEPEINPNPNPTVVPERESPEPTRPF